MRFETASAAETEAAGAELARRLVRGDTVFVSGELGSGKTTFIRGACRALEVKGRVTSPTFAIGQLYVGEAGGAPIEIAHLDLYRLDSAPDEDQELLEDYLTGERIGFVEWPGELVTQLTRVAARVRIDHAGADCRRSIEIA